MLILSLYDIWLVIAPYLDRRVSGLFTLFLDCLGDSIDTLRALAFGIEGDREATTLEWVKRRDGQSELPIDCAEDRRGLNTHPAEGLKGLRQCGVVLVGIEDLRPTDIAIHEEEVILGEELPILVLTPLGGDLLAELGELLQGFLVLGYILDIGGSHSALEVDM